MIARIPPHSVETEQVVLGTMMLSSKSIPVVLSKIDKEDFYKPNHTVIFEAIAKVFNGGLGVDALSPLGHR